MTDKAGTFVWHELMTNDVDAALAFYGRILNWNAKDAGMSDMRYMLASVGETPVAGVMDLNSPGCPEGIPVGWTGYIAVEDVDAWTDKVTAAGGVLHMGPADIPGVGRFSTVGDPQGAVTCLFKSSTGPYPKVDITEQGAPCWAELHAADGEAAWDWYRPLFGWEEKMAMDMGPDGTYRIFGKGEEQFGGMFSDKDQNGFWSYYFSVPDIDAAAEAVKAAGGQVVYGPQEVPGGFILNAIDPQGGLFGLAGPRNA